MFCYSELVTPSGEVTLLGPTASKADWLSYLDKQQGNHKENTKTDLKNDLGCFDESGQSENEEFYVDNEFDHSMETSDRRAVKVFDIKKMKSRFEKTKEKSLKNILGRFDFETDDGYRFLNEVDESKIDALKSLGERYSNCSEFIEYVIGFTLLSLRKEYSSLNFPPVLLIGPPGVGKTDISHQVAGILGVPSKSVDMGSASSSFVLGGASSTWSDSKAGAIVDILRDSESASGIVILDEIDKANNDAKYAPLGPLYSLLESNTASKFVDEAIEIPIDASNIMYVATANKLEMIEEAILNRFIIIKIEGISRSHHRIICHSIYRGVLYSHELDGIFNKILSEEVLDTLYKYSPRTEKLLLIRATSIAAIRDLSSSNLDILVGDITEQNMEDSKTPIGFT
jgi:ATP-dependent Lon protease